MNHLTMLSYELAPHRIDGGLGIAIERISRQLTNSGQEVTVIFPTDETISSTENKYGKLTTITIPAKYADFTSDRERAEALTNFCLKAVDVCLDENAEIIICHDNETALASALLNERGHQNIFWLHSLYDTPRKFEFPKIATRIMPTNSLLATGIANSMLVVTSSGIIADAKEFLWPNDLRDAQTALLAAHSAGNTLLVESLGCLPEINTQVVNYSVSTKYGFGKRPFVFFASRPTLSKGICILNAIAKVMNNDDIDFIAVGNPTADIAEHCTHINWIPWLEKKELFRLMEESRVVVHPSLTEGFGLSAAESSVYASNTLCHPVGGLRNLIECGVAESIQLSTNEKEILYEIWAKRINSTPDSYWNFWIKKLPELSALVDSWVTSIRDIPINTPYKKKGKGTELWGNKIMEASQELKLF